MINEESLKTWEQEHIELLTSREMGEWLHRRDMNARQQGEWVDHSDEGYIECPFCGNATNCEDNKDELHYCWHCGAKMKGGTKE